MPSATAIILAAGEGTRMKSQKPKVLHEVAGRSMLAQVLDAVKRAGLERAAVVVGPDRVDVAEAAEAVFPGVAVAVQAERRGTAHAVLAAREIIAAGDDLIVLYGDTPLLTPSTIKRLAGALAAGGDVVVAGFETAEPTGYGRLIVEGETLVAIVEEKDANEAQRAVRLCNGGMMALSGRHALALLEAIGNANAKGEFYLTDAVGLAHGRGLATRVETIAEEEVLGVNDRVQLAAAEAVVQRRLRERAMRGGATLIAPETVFLSHDTVIGQDVTIEPWCWFGPGVTIADGAVIHGFSHLEGATVGPQATVGPYGRLRPGARLAKKAKVGNFVEVKAADIGEGAKLSHLIYVGDASVGADANLGAGTITCNYDGFVKARTVIGRGAFIGSNTALVAPVTVGDGANVGAGSVITKDVAPDALAVARGRQVEKGGWAKAFRERRAAEKAAGKAAKPK
jgi:bifunctional UDP-N-acetylglucosamine pyrophosphorylase/glucosamine-1-phosphate N-acetyltransferase